MNETRGKRPVVVCEESEAYSALEVELARLAGVPAIRASEAELPAALGVQDPCVVVLAAKACDGMASRIRSVRAALPGRAVGVIVTADRPLQRVPRGANAMLQKPFDPAAFVSALKRLQDVAPRHRSSAEIRIRPSTPLGAGGAAEASAVIVNLSESGMLLATRSPLRVGEEVEIEGRADAGDFVLSGAVVRRATERGKGYFAIRFAQARRYVRHAMETFRLLQDRSPAVAA